MTTKQNGPTLYRPADEESARAWIHEAGRVLAEARPDPQVMRLLLVKGSITADSLALADSYRVKRRAFEDAARLDAFAEIAAALTNETTGLWLRTFAAFGMLPDGRELLRTMLTNLQEA
jgi:hypothetical protein